MTSEQVWLAAAGAVALVALVLALLGARRARRAEALAAALAERIALLESPATDAPRPVDDAAERGARYVITAARPRPTTDP